MQRYLVRRAIAYLIDSTLACGLLCLNFVTIMVSMIASGGPDADLTVPAVIANAVSFVVTVPLAFGYFLLKDGIVASGLGKWIAGLRVIDANTGIAVSRFLFHYAAGMRRGLV